jgi:hypothetical protein
LAGVEELRLPERGSPTSVVDTIRAPPMPGVEVSVKTAAFVARSTVKANAATGATGSAR